MPKESEAISSHVKPRSIVIWTCCSSLAHFLVLEYLFVLRLHRQVVGGSFYLGNISQPLLTMRNCLHDLLTGWHMLCCCSSSLEQFSLSFYCPLWQMYQKTDMADHLSNDPLRSAVVRTWNIGLESECLLLMVRTYWKPGSQSTFVSFSMWKRSCFRLLRSNKWQKITSTKLFPSLKPRRSSIIKLRANYLLVDHHLVAKMSWRWWKMIFS